MVHKKIDSYHIVETTFVIFKATNYNLPRSLGLSNYKMLVDGKATKRFI